jgi:hypothetical protein
MMREAEWLGTEEAFGLMVTSDTNFEPGKPVS